MEAGEGDITKAIKQFLERYIRSLDQLEVLLLVSALPDREWSVDEVYNVVRSSPGVVRERLDYFTAAGMLSCTTGDVPVRYRFQPRNADMQATIAALSTAYKISRHKIVELIYSRPEPGDPLIDFSDAFRLKKGDK